MTNFVVSDTHFHHKNILKNAHRPFASVEEMNETMVQKWNAKVKPSDCVYHLGDVAMWKPEHLAIALRLNGVKYLIGGNHDTFHHWVYTRSGFKDVLPMKEFGRDTSGRAEIVCAHIPVHPMCIGFGTGKWNFNVHGHIHEERVMTGGNRWLGMEDVPVIDPRYYCVSVEHTDFAPISLEELRGVFANQLSAYRDYP